MKRIIISFTALFLVLVTSCRKDEKDKFDGPSLAENYGKFAIIDSLVASRDSVDFSAGELVYFTAAVNKTINWKIEITGMTSGAVKEITGLGKDITLNEATWNGSITQFPMFKSEWCAVQLTFTGEDDTLNTMVKVIQPKVNQGYVIADFENGFNSGWGSFIQSGANMDFQIHTDNFAPQAGSYLNMAGTVNWDWLIGMVNFKASADGHVVYPLSSNPNNLYFNAMVYGEPGLINSLVLFRFQEDENADGTFTAASEDEYAYQVTVNWVGWKLISIKYADIVSLVNGSPVLPNGNQTHNPDKIKQVDMLHLANPASGFASSKLDYIIFTENGPLAP